MRRRDEVKSPNRGYWSACLLSSSVWSEEGRNLRNTLWLLIVHITGRGRTMHVIKQTPFNVRRNRVHLTTAVIFINALS